MKNKIIKLIENKIKDLESRITREEKDEVIKEYCIRRLELLWLLDDIKEVLGNE